MSWNKATYSIVGAGTLPDGTPIPDIGPGHLVGPLPDEPETDWTSIALGAAAVFAALLGVGYLMGGKR